MVCYDVGHELFCFFFCYSVSTVKCDVTVLSFLMSVDLVTGRKNDTVKLFPHSLKTTEQHKII